MKKQIQKFAKRISTLGITGLISLSISAQVVAHFPMEPEQNSIRETQTNRSFTIEGNFAPESKPGVEGNALRFDGYTTYIDAEINSTALSDRALTFSLWCAVETYPMMNPDGAVNLYSVLAGNMDDEKRSGFAFLVSSQGDYSFEFYMNGWKVTCQAQEKLPKYEWNQLAAVIDVDARQLILYRNGVQVGSQQVNGTISTGESRFIIGKSFEDLTAGPFLINTFNGLMDEIRIYNTALSVSELGYQQPENAVDLSIPASRYADDIFRPRYHGMPATAWTNEPHGLIFYDNKYHLFFQKNANGPYWGRLHWGHITSENLYEWEEEKIALAPSEWYDWKGCWSGCIYVDKELTGGKPYIYYTAVDNSRASIAEAYPLDDQLIDWEKDPANPIIPHRPDGLSDDFRDPYLFSANGKHYMIVGTSKEGRGAATLHEYNSSTKTWSNDGRIFFQSTNANISGNFWEMPVIIQMENGKWLFLVTPLSGKEGVEVLYWVGTINGNGMFEPLSSFANGPREVELGTFGKDGYGLLSPSLCHKDGKTIAIGIVPDKLSSENNYTLGWAHTFSLPREWTLDANDNLIQKPYQGLELMRSRESFSEKGLSVSNSYSLDPVAGRSVEVKADITVGDASRSGFRFFKTGSRSVEVYYDYTSNKLVVDARTTVRLTNDNGVFNGLYESVLPERLEKGSILNLQVFVDHSIMDIFINNKWAFSIRVFPTDAAATGVEAFSEGGTTIFNSVEGWILDSGQGSGSGIAAPGQTAISAQAIGDKLFYKDVPPYSVISFYDLSGRLVGSTTVTDSEGSCEIPLKGLAIVSVTGKGINHTTKIFSDK